MPVTLSVKNVPDEVVERLRDRARRNHRSLQGELMAIVERASQEPLEGPVAPMTVQTLYEWAKTQGLSPTNESTAVIRQMRDERAGHVERVLAKARGRR